MKVQAAAALVTGANYGPGDAVAEALQTPGPRCDGAGRGGG